MAKITLYYINGNTFTFNKDDYMEIRKKYRIKGNLLGCVSTQPKNINFGGLPAIFSSLESQLLYEKNLITLKRYDLNSIPENCRILYELELKKLREDQHLFSKINKLESIKNIMPKIIEGKKAKMIKMGIPIEEIYLAPEQILSSESYRYVDINNKNCLTQIPTEYPFSKENLETMILPKDLSLNFQIYCEIWEKGKYITDGNSFGCDFLVYPGDPIHFHASHVVYIFPDQPIISPKMLTSIGRLSVSVNKICIFAYYNKALKKNIYQEMKWQGNKL